MSGPEGAGGAVTSAQRLSDAGDHVGALAAADRAIALDPSRADALTARGWALENLGYLMDAREAYREAVRVDPGELWAKEGLSNVLRRLGLPGSIPFTSRFAFMTLYIDHEVPAAQRSRLHIVNCSWYNRPRRVTLYSSHMTKPLRILLYYADTGGGHRATAQAIAEGLKYRYGEAVDPVLLDGLRKYVPYPLSRLDDMYPWMSGMSKTWGRSWTQLNDPDRAIRFMKLWWPYVRTACIRLAKEPCDAVSNVQPLYTFPVLWAMERIGVRKPFVTMVSDLIVVHALWCDPTTVRRPRRVGERLLTEPGRSAHSP